MFTLTGVVARCLGGAAMRANIREILTSATTVGCVIALGAAATVFAGTILWIPYTRKKMADRSEQCAAAVAEAAKAVKFETLYWDEYDALLTAATTTATTENPVTEHSPQGDAVTMVYLPDRSAFGYYTDRKSSISYPQLETIARKYLVDNAQRDVAKRAYADRRSKTKTATTTATTAESLDTDVVDLGTESKDSNSVASASASAAGGGGGGGGIFAMFRRYNRKPASASASSDKADEAPLEYTRFVYLGSMHDYANKNKRASSASSASSASGSASDSDAAIDYADFKRLKIASAPPTRQ